MGPGIYAQWYLITKFYIKLLNGKTPIMERRCPFLFNILGSQINQLYFNIEVAVMEFLVILSSI